MIRLPVVASKPANKSFNMCAIGRATSLGAKRISRIDPGSATRRNVRGGSGDADDQSRGERKGYRIECTDLIRQAPEQTCKAEYGPVLALR
jgi:hypothetical protein